MQSLGDILILSCNKATKKQGLFSLAREVRENQAKREEKTSSSHNQCRYANGEHTL